VTFKCPHTKYALYHTTQQSSMLNCAQHSTVYQQLYTVICQKDEKEKRMQTTVLQLS